MPMLTRSRDWRWYRTLPICSSRLRRSRCRLQPCRP
jgi:hypothetical protein